MKAYLRDKQSFVAVSPVPKKDTPGGLKIVLDTGIEMETDIVKGTMRYDIPEHVQGRVKSVTATE
jgi:hypothetical protein